MRFVILWMGMMLLGISSPAQTIVLDRAPGIQIGKPRHWGRNRDNFISPNAEITWALGPQARYARLDIFPSYNVRLGVVYKRKINSWLSLGPSFQYSTERLVLSQESSKKLPDSQIHKAEWFNLQCITAGFFVRFNMDKKRGNVHGIFWEFGANYVYVPRFTHVIREVGQNGENIEIRLDNNLYTVSGYAEVWSKLGFYHVAVTARYRFTPLFKNAYDYPDPSPVKVGLGFFF